MEKATLAAALIALIAPEGATDLSIGGTNYKVRNGEVEVPREVAHHAYAFGYTNKPVPQPDIEAEAERVRVAQAEMDAANAKLAAGAEDAGTGEQSTDAAEAAAAAAEAADKAGDQTEAKTDAKPASGASKAK